MSQKTLTVFTPAYNRANTLRRTYESLRAQTCKDFEWLVIDDGSTDDTGRLVAGWIDEADFGIRYIYKENGGLFTGYNTAVANMDSEINVCIDSDDFMPPTAVADILEEWEKVKNDDKIAGLIGLDYYINGGPIGGEFAAETDIHLQHLASKLGHKGDMKIVCRTALMKRFYPMPSFGEKNFNPIWYFLNIDEDHLFRTVNKNFCFVEYQPDGMTAATSRQYANSPRSFAELRKLAMTSRHTSWKRKYISAAHYVSSSIFAKDFSMISASPRPWLTIAAIPAGLVMHLIIKRRLGK